MKRILRTAIVLLFCALTSCSPKRAPQAHGFSVPPQEIHFGPPTLVAEQFGEAQLSTWRRKDMLELTVLVNNVPGLFLLDTGCAFTSVTKPMSEALGLRTLGRIQNTVAGPQRVEAAVYEECTFEVPGILPCRLLAFQVDLSQVNLERAADKMPAYDGVLGIDFLQFRSAAVYVPNRSIQALNKDIDFGRDIRGQWAAALLNTGGMVAADPGDTSVDLADGRIVFRVAGEVLYKGKYVIHYHPDGAVIGIALDAPGYVYGRIAYNAAEDALLMVMPLTPKSEFRLFGLGAGAAGTHFIVFSRK